MFVPNISFVFPLLFHSFYSSKFQKMKFVFLFPLFLIFKKIPIFLFKKNPIDYIFSYPCNLLGFGLYSSSLHINVYHVFEVNFE
jgi:hypothetical protein